MKGQKLDDSTYMKYLEKANLCRQKENYGLPRAGEMGNGSYCLMVTEFLFVVMKKFWKYIVVHNMVAQYCECNQWHSIAYFKIVKMAIFVICIYIIKK